MRNGDVLPTRFDAQNDAANLISTSKVDSNPESTVAVISMAGKRFSSFYINNFLLKKYSISSL